MGIIGPAYLRRFARTYSGLLLWMLCLACRSAYAAPADLQEAVLELTLNAEESGDARMVLRGPQNQLYLDENDFSQLRLHLPQTEPYLRDGHRYYAPASIEGCTVQIDETRQRAVITVPAWALDTTHVSAADRRHPNVTPASPGAFLNYQASTQHIGGQTTGGIYGEFGVFAGAGVLTNTAVVRYDGSQQQTIRLDTTYTHDFPSSLQTLSLGDAISDPGSWGNAVRYAGVRWSRNFGLRPDLLTTPLLSTAGTATVPSTVDVFVNNQLVTSNQVPAGPFVIDRLPTVSGTGDVSVVVRDALGRDQVVTQSFYSSSSLLARGLSQYSINVGSVRNDYALASDHYGKTLGEVSYRRGITDTFTLEGHGEYLAGDAHAAGFNAMLGIGHIGLINFTAAGGGASAGSGLGGDTANQSGWLGGVGIEHRGTNTSFVANSLWASRDFAQVGEAINPAFRMRQRTLLQTGVGVGRFGSLSLAYVRQTYQASPAQQTVSLTHSLNLGHWGTVNLTVTQTHSDADLAGYGNSAGYSGSNSYSLPTNPGIPSVGAPMSIVNPSSTAQNSTSAYLIFVFPIDGRRAASLTTVGGSGSGAPTQEVIAAVTESPPAGPGSGYRLSASTAGNYDADWRQQFHSADVEVEVARNAGLEGRSAYLSGAMTWLDGQVNATRSVSGSFAMVDVAGLADVPVYVENQLTTHTDSSGRALLYNLRPYEANRISIAPEDLPLDTTISASSAVMAPPYRSGVVARFPVERVRGGTFRLVTENGEPVPVGATVTLGGKDFPVVMNGVVYVTGYDRGLSANAAWPGGRCNFRLDPPPADEPLPDMGKVSCRSDAARAGR